MTDILAIPFLIILAPAIFMIPELGLVLCMAVSVFVKGLIQPQVGALDITAYVFVVTYGSILIRKVVQDRNIQLPPSRINLAICLFILILLASLLYTPLFQQGSNIFFRFVLLDISMLYMTFLWAINLERIKKLLFIFSGFTLAYGALTLILLLSGELSTRPFFRGVPVTAAPITIGIFLAASALISLVLKELTQNKWQRTLLMLLALLSTIQLIATNSRGPLIALFWGMMLLLFYSRRLLRRHLLVEILAIVAVIFIAFLVLPWQYTARYVLFFDPTSTSLAWRLGAAQFVLDHFSDWFFGGVGLFGFAYHYCGEAPSLCDADLPIFGAYPHNIFLDVFSDTGFIGLLIFAWLIGYLLYVGIKVSRWRDKSFRLVAIATFIALVVFLVNALFSVSLIDTRPIWFFGGIILSLQRLWRKSESLYTHLSSASI